MKLKIYSYITSDENDPTTLSYYYTLNIPIDKMYKEYNITVDCDYLQYIINMGYGDSQVVLHHLVLVQQASNEIGQLKKLIEEYYES